MEVLAEVLLLMEVPAGVLLLMEVLAVVLLPTVAPLLVLAVVHLPTVVPLLDPLWHLSAVPRLTVQLALVDLAQVVPLTEAPAVLAEWEEVEA